MKIQFSLRKKGTRFPTFGSHTQHCNPGIKLVGPTHFCSFIFNSFINLKPCKFLIWFDILSKALGWVTIRWGNISLISLNKVIDLIDITQMGSFVSTFSNIFFFLSTIRVRIYVKKSISFTRGITQNTE